MRRLFSILGALLLCTSLWAATETLVVGTYANANGWTNTQVYTSAATDNVTFTGEGSGNNCKYYSTGNGTWRFYSSGGGAITIAVPAGNYITKIALTINGTSYFTTAPTGWDYADKVFTPQSGTKVNSVKISNGSGTTQVEKIAVTYEELPKIYLQPTGAVAGGWLEAEAKTAAYFYGELKSEK